MNTFCRFCEGDLVACECDEVTGDDSPEATDWPEVDDSRVVWSVSDSGVGRIEVLP